MTHGELTYACTTTGPPTRARRARIEQSLLHGSCTPRGPASVESGLSGRQRHIEASKPRGFESLCAHPR